MESVRYGNGSLKATNARNAMSRVVARSNRIVDRREHRTPALKAEASPVFLLEQVLNSLPEGIAILDGETLTLKWANPSFWSHVGYAAPGPRDITLDRIIPGASAGGLAAATRSVVATGRACTNLIYQVQTPTGGRRVLRLALRPLAGYEGATPHLMLQAADITAHMRGPH